MATPRSAGPVSLSRPAVFPKLDTRVLWTLGGILAAAVVLRFLHLTEDSFWLDEGVSVRIARLDLLELGRASAGDTHPPLYYLLLHVWMAIFGDSELAIRSLSALIGAAVVPVVFWLGRELAGTRVGLAAALFTAVSPLQIEYSQEARNYILLALLAGLSFLTLVRLIDRPTRWTAIAYVAFTAGLLYTHVWGLFILLAQAVFLLGLVVRTTEPSPERRAKLLRYARIQGAALVLYLPWLAVIAFHTREEIYDVGQIGWIPRPSASSLADTLAAYAGSKAGLALTAAVATAALLIGWRRLRTSSTGLLAAWLTIPILVPFSLSLGPFSLYQVKYTIASSLAYFLLVATFCFVFSPRVLRVALVAAITVPLIVGTAQYFRSHEKEDWRAAAQYIEQHASSGDLVLFDVPYTQKDAFAYYFDRPDVIERPGRDGLLVGTPPHAADRVWVVIARPGDPDSTVPPDLGRSYEQTLAQHFYRVDVAFYVRPETSTP